MSYFSAKLASIQPRTGPDKFAVNQYLRTVTRDLLHTRREVTSGVSEANVSELLGSQPHGRAKKSPQHTRRHVPEYLADSVAVVSKNCFAGFRVGCGGGQLRHDACDEENRPCIDCRITFTDG